MNSNTIQHLQTSAFLMLFAANVAHAQVSIGSTKQDVIATLGYPIAQYEIGDKEVLGYGNSGKIEIQGDKVVTVSGDFGDPPDNSPSMVPVSGPQETIIPQTNQSSVISKSLRSVEFKDSEWTILGRQNLGKELKSYDKPFVPDAKTSGQFVLVLYRVKNKTNKEECIFVGPVLVDVNGNEYREYDNSSSYVGGKKISMEALPANMERKFFALYEVPASYGLRFQARTLSMFPETVLLELP